MGDELGIRRWAMDKMGMQFLTGLKKNLSGIKHIATTALSPHQKS
jgi:hypothetical protein